MKCPKCRTVPLLHKLIDGLDFHYCQKCKGVLLTEQYLNNFIDTAVVDLKIPADCKYGHQKCSTCRITMNQFYYPQTSVTVDLCKNCNSLWLDSGELQEIEKVRNQLDNEGRLETYVPEGSIKAKMLNFVNSTVKALSSFS